MYCHYLNAQCDVLTLFSVFHSVLSQLLCQLRCWSYLLHGLWFDWCSTYPKIQLAKVWITCSDNCLCLDFTPTAWTSSRGQCGGCSFKHVLLTYGGGSACMCHMCHVGEVFTRFHKVLWPKETRVIKVTCYSQNCLMCFCTTLAGSYMPDRVYTPLTMPLLHIPPGRLSAGFCPVRTAKSVLCSCCDAAVMLLVAAGLQLLFLHTPTSSLYITLIGMLRAGGARALWKSSLTHTHILYSRTRAGLSTPRRR